MRIAVVGGGIFGCTAAIHLAKTFSGSMVHLYEQHHDIMIAASGINQYRLHEGYHYPRSLATALECRRGNRSFREEYGKAVIDDGRQFYGLVSGGLTTAENYRKFCEAAEMPYVWDSAKRLWSRSLRLTLKIRVKEGRIHPTRLRHIVRGKLLEAHVRQHLGTLAPPKLRNDYDRIVVASYAGTNRVLAELGCPTRAYQFEVCEKPVVRMPDWFGRDISAVVMDGEFGCIDPFANTGLHILGHVKHAIHARNVGFEPEIPDHLAGYIDHAIIGEPAGTRFKAFIDDMVEFIPSLREAKHVGSMFTVRAVLADQDETDARPTMVERLDDQVIRVFSGKIGTCVEAARDVAALLEDVSRPVMAAAS